MAQLNYYTYLSQVTSLIIIYLLYYSINKQTIIPTIVEKIKIKNYILNQFNNSKLEIENTTLDLRSRVGIENKYYIKIIK